MLVTNFTPKHSYLEMGSLGRLHCQKSVDITGMLSLSFSVLCRRHCIRYSFSLHAHIWNATRPLAYAFMLKFKLHSSISEQLH